MFNIRLIWVDFKNKAEGPHVHSIKGKKHEGSKVKKINTLNLATYQVVYICLSQCIDLPMPRNQVGVEFNPCTGSSTE